jgi:hypothetical protein
MQSVRELEKQKVLVQVLVLVVVLERAYLRC